MENFVISNCPEMEDNELNKLLNWLRYCYNAQQKHFAELCFTIYKICGYCKDKCFKAKDNEYYDCNKLLNKFGFDKNAISRYKNCYERFCQGSDIQNVFIKDYFCNFCPSKLFEMLSLSYETLEKAVDSKLIKPEMTVKEIRAFIKELKSGHNVTNVVEEDLEVNEEEIPFVYDPKQEYEYSYFESKTKNQLLNIVWELQGMIQKLLKKEKRNETRNIKTQ